MKKSAPASQVSAPPLPPGIDELATGGHATAGLFELKSPAQYAFRANGGCKVARGSRMRTRLNNLTTGQSLDIAGADIGEGIDSRFVIRSGASLLLAPGTYNWLCEVQPNPADAIDEASLTATVANSPEPIETRGVREAFSLVSGRQGRNVVAIGSFTAAIGDSEYAAARLVVTDLSTNQQFASPLIEIVGPTQEPESTGAVPYILTEGHIYRAFFRVDYAGTGRIACTLTQSGVS
jgi:hypothetical protein